MIEQIKNKVFGILILIFSLMGLIFLIVSISLLIYMNNYKTNGIRTTATIKEFSYIREDNGKYQTDYYLSYYVNDIEYFEELSARNSSYDSGDEITIYYLESNPSKYLDVLTISIVGYVFLSIGSVFLLTSIIIAIVFLKGRRIVKLKEYGISHRCIIDKIEENSFFPINSGENLKIKKIVCISSDKTTYVSKAFSDKVDNLEKGNIVNVYVDPKKEKRYYVDYKNIKKNDFIVDF